MTGIHRALLQTLTLASAITFVPSLAAQTPTTTVDPPFSQIAALIARPIQEQQLARVVVADLRSPEGTSHPGGRWLASQISESLSEDFPSLEV